MKSLVLSLLLCNPASVFAQTDTDVVSVFIKVEKEYAVNLAKGYFSYDMDRGNYDIKTDSVSQKRYDVKVEIKNKSLQPIYIWLMTCSWQDNVEINNNYISYEGIRCDANFPELVRIDSGKTKNYKAVLSKSIKFGNPCTGCVFGPQVETTKLGLIIVDDLFKPKFGLWGYLLAMEDKSKWMIVWSNPLYFLTDEEANPRPVQIPVFRKP